MNIIESTRPYILDGKLVRYGRNIDGGYIVNKKYTEISEVLYTYGVGDDISFERDLLNDNPMYKCNLYDPAVKVWPTINGNVHKYVEGLSIEKKDNYDSFFNHLKNNNDEDKKILLKIDIEGAEFDFLNNVDLDKLDNVVQMVIEFHLEDNYINDFINITNRINEYYYIIHLHGNTYRPFVKVGNCDFPQVPEITYVNKKYVKETPVLSTLSYPIEGLDYNNGGHHPQWSIKYV